MSSTFADSFGAYVKAANAAGAAFNEQLEQEQLAFAERFDATFTNQESINFRNIEALGVPCIDCLAIVTSGADGHEIKCTYPAEHGPGALSKGFYAKCGRRWIS